MTCEILGRTVEAALSSLPKDAPRPQITLTAAPRRDGTTRKDGALRVVAVRDGEWICAWFQEKLGNRD